MAETEAFVSLALYYNDQPPETIFYQGLALRRLGRNDEAVVVFQKLADYGESHLDDEIQEAYFAVSLPDFLVFDEDPVQQNRIHCLYMHGLGQLGLENRTLAEASFNRVLERAPFHIGAALHKRMLAQTKEN